MALGGIAERFLAYVQDLRDRGISMNSMAATADLSNGMIGKWLAGTANPSLDSLEKFLKAYPNVNAEWLLLGRGEMSTSIVQETGMEYGKRSMMDLQLEVEKLKGENQGLREALEIVACRTIPTPQPDQP